MAITLSQPGKIIPHISRKAEPATIPRACGSKVDLALGGSVRCDLETKALKIEQPLSQSAHIQDLPALPYA
ncbi:hypothetical protein ACTMTF_49025 [Nonomuraea sp. ZG12]|uniref:hypothetical protein n=1 Tax=Nonomuraea sp. ZG12 TaxID=3452207 RepID=UPI003F89EA03